MPSKNIAFIFTSAFGHLIKTPLIANFYIEKGHNVRYFVAGKNKVFFNENPYSFATLSSKPFAAAPENMEGKGLRRMSWLNTLIKQHFGNDFEKRKAEIEAIVKEFKPDLIFLDVFCVSDFIILFPYLKNVKCVVLSPFLPSIVNDSIAPLNVFTKNTDDVKKIWEAHLKETNRQQLLRKIKYLFGDNISVLKRKMKKMKMNANHEADFSWQGFPVFKNLEKWYLQPVETDFHEQKLPEYQRYMGPMVNLIRQEQENTRYNDFVKRVDIDVSNKFIFCSLGSVIVSLEKDKEIVLKFYRTITQIAFLNPTWHIVLKVPKLFISMIKPLSKNIFIDEYVPYLAMLNRADVFVTHCGGNCYLESIFMETPMLAVPPSDSWDYNGNAARVVHYNLGLKGSLIDSAAELTSMIDQLISRISYLDNVKKMNALLRKNYPANYLDNMHLPLP